MMRVFGGGDRTDSLASMLGGDKCACDVSVKKHYISSQGQFILCEEAYFSVRGAKDL